MFWKAQLYILSCVQAAVLDMLSSFMLQAIAWNLFLKNKTNKIIIV